jgi:hypothetical protein
MTVKNLTMTLEDGRIITCCARGQLGLVFGLDCAYSLAGLLGVVDGIERIVEDGSLDHFGE